MLGLSNDVVSSPTPVYKNDSMKDYLISTISSVDTAKCRLGSERVEKQ